MMTASLSSADLSSACCLEERAKQYTALLALLVCLDWLAAGTV